MGKACSEFVAIAQHHPRCRFWTNHRNGHFHSSWIRHLCLTQGCANLSAIRLSVVCAGFRFNQEGATPESTC